MLNQSKKRIQNIWQSFLELPLWVKVWISVFLFPANLWAFFMTHTPSGNWAAIAFIFVLVTNMPIMWIEQSMSRLMAVPHLFAWTPLEIALLFRLLDNTDVPTITGEEYFFAITLVIINGISLVFDAFDSWRWFKERENNNQLSSD